MMDRVLSYQTAMRASTSDASGFDIRQYISKRTCISMTMSIAFIALIFGFLLGKFTSDRNHILKDNKRTHDIPMHRPTVMQNEIDKVISSVIDTARTKQLTNYKDQYSREDDDSAAAKSYMSLLSTNFTSCLNEATIESVDESLEDYLNNLLRNYYNVYLKCARDLRSILIQND